MTLSFSLAVPAETDFMVKSPYHTTPQEGDEVVMKAVTRSVSLNDPFTPGPRYRSVMTIPLSWKTIGKP